jgi:hypothetical protein
MWSLFVQALAVHGPICHDQVLLEAEEIKALIGVQIVMGVLPAPAQDMYWFKDKLFHPSCIEMKFTSKLHGRQILTC